MPWIWIGAVCFDLCRVEMIRRADNSVVVILKNGSEIDLSGDDAADFVREWEDYAKPRVITRAPPRVLRPALIVPDQSEVARD